MTNLTCVILGCGGSMGVPQIGCNCVVCKSDNPKNKRLRASILLQSDTTTVLIDAAPDLRTFALRHNINKVDALIITHAHSDHFSGIDDMKPIVHLNGSRAIPTYMLDQTFEQIGTSYKYIFEDTGSDVYRPILERKHIEEFDQIQIGDIQIQLFPQQHGSKMISLGMKIGNFAYSTDVNGLPDASFKILDGIETWIVDCLRYHYAPTHTNYQQTLEWIERVKPKQAILTHMAHEIDYDEILKILPKDVIPAFDGMVIPIRQDNS